MRIRISKFLIKAGIFLQEIPVYFLRPKQLTKFGRESYSKASSVNFWAGKDFVNSGLLPGEKELFNKLPVKNGDLLILGLGGGREAIFLGKNGFNVTGVDFVDEMVEKAVENGKDAGIRIHGKVQDVSSLDFNLESFDVVWFSCSIYSSIPGRNKRIKVLSESGKILKHDGYVACFFYWNPQIRSGRFRWKLGKFLSKITFGNTKYEKGDILKDNYEFLHAFFDTEDLNSEFKSAGFEVVQYFFPENSHNACALLKKA
ncbi:MAG: class I SAM-dependent methyltransferase [Acidobacteriota bacterium]